MMGSQPQAREACPYGPGPPHMQHVLKRTGVVHSGGSKQVGTLGKCGPCQARPGGAPKPAPHLCKTCWPAQVVAAAGSRDSQPATSCHPIPLNPKSCNPKPYTPMHLRATRCCLEMRVPEHLRAMCRCLGDAYPSQLRRMLGHLCLLLGGTVNLVME